MGHSTACKVHFTLTLHHCTSPVRPLSQKDPVGICGFFIKKRREERSGRGVAFVCEAGGREGGCSLLMFLFYFSKVCTEEQFQEKVLTCPGNELFARKQRSMVVPIFSPLLPPSSCCFCPPIYLLLVYTFQLLFSAPSCFPALSACSYIQLHHPTHSLQSSSFY